MNFRLYLETALKITIQYIVPLILMTLVMAIISLTTFFILLPVMMAGYMQAVLLMLRDGREPKIQDIFSHFRLFFPLIGFMFISFVIIIMGLKMFFFPGVLASLALSFICLYMLPLMTDKNMGVVDAVKESYRITTQNERVVDHLIAAILFTSISSIGLYTVIGWIITQPFAAVFLMLIYEDQVNQRPIHSMFTPAEPPETK